MRGLSWPLCASNVKLGLWLNNGRQSTRALPVSDDPAASITDERYAKGRTLNETISRINENRTVFDDIYAEPYPHAYFSVLGALDYMIPDVAEPVIRQALNAPAHRHGEENTILDVGCSYGINAAIHRFPVSFAILRQRCARREIMALDAEEMIRLDRPRLNKIEIPC